MMTLDEMTDVRVVGTPIEILLVEDNPEDAALTMETLREGRIRNHVTLVEDGVEALDFLRRREPYGNARRPDLILLDLQLPRKNGREVLEDIKADQSLKRIPVIIMTTVDDREIIRQVYSEHANRYVNKPVDLDEFIDVVRSIEDFWLTIVKLPAA